MIQKLLHTFRSNAEKETMRIQVKEEFHLIFFAMLTMSAEALTFIQL